MGVKIVVCGGKKFRDVKLLHRALDAFHRKHSIETLITGEFPGAEELAYFWAVSKHIREVITAPTTSDLMGRYSPQRRNLDVLQRYAPFAIISFPGSDNAASHLIQTAKELGHKVWEVSAEWR